MLKQSLWAFCCGLMSVSAVYAANPNQEFADFFAQYEQLGNADDPKVVALYADDAKITMYSTSADGIGRSMTMTGKKLKELYLENIDMIKQVGSKTTSSKVNIERTADGAKIRAHRYGNLKCFTDPDYYMVVSRADDKKLYITEEYVQTSDQSYCKDGVKDDLALQLALGASMMRKNLPMQVDPETTLQQVEAKEKAITFSYQLIHFDRDELDQSKLELEMVPQIISQSCRNTGFRDMLDKGALMNFNYFDREALPILNIHLTKKDCE